MLQSQTLGVVSDGKVNIARLFYKQTLKIRIAYLIGLCDTWLEIDYLTENIYDTY